MIRSDRVRALMEAQGLSQTELARRVEVTQGAIAKIVGNSPAGSSHLHKIARVLGTTPEYLTGEHDDPSAGAVPVPTVEQIAEYLDLVDIASIDFAYGMGGTFADGSIEESVMRFPRPWVEAISISPPKLLTWARGRGDSMSPTINDNDVILIDRSQRKIGEQDAIWALTVGDIGMVKRLRVRGDRIAILSDNDRVPLEEAYHGEVNIVGRVVFIGRRV